MATKTTTKRSTINYGGGPSFTAKSIRAAKKRGEEVPHTNSRKAYRDDMAQIARVEDRGNKEQNKFHGRPPKRYYRQFDRGAKRAAARQAARRTGR